MTRAQGWARRGAFLTALLGAVTLCASSASQAQGYFGQNQVQYDRLDWRIIETEHFLVHYYPVEHEAAVDAARMAERGYARMSRILGHQFREKKPIIVYASRGDFAQSNVFGDLGEGTGGVTDPVRQRMAQPLTGDYRTFEHVLQHEMVHQFQFDIFSRGRAGAGLQNLGQVNPPLWFMEGMAEFLSLGYNHPQTDAWVRDAVLNGTFPTIEEMTLQPNRYFPYRYGFSLWQYVAGRWGDEVVGEIMNAVPNIGIERAFKRETGLSLEELSDEWREAMQTKHLPQVATLDRARKFSQPLLTQRKTGGVADLYIAPALSPDGKYIAFISYGNLLRGEVFPDLYLADAQTGKRIKRLVKSTTNNEFEELRQLYSQSAFSPDGKFLAFTAQRRGKDVLYLLDVKKRETVKRFDLPLEGVTSPTWSPDGKRLAFSGTIGGISDLYMVDASGTNFRQLTKDKHGDNQPQWSPDGKTIAFASDRGPETDFEVLRLGRWKISLLDLESGRVSLLPDQDGLNINPQWAPDGQSLAFVSDRTGIANVFLYDLKAREHYQLTNVIGAVNAETEYSPAITWARQADQLAYTYYEKGVNNVWSIKNPRLLKKQPFRDSTASAIVASAGRDSGGVPTATAPANAAQLATVDSTPESRSYYRTTASTFRSSAAVPAPTKSGFSATLSVAALLDSAALELPDTARFKDAKYRAGFQPEYIAQPQVGYAQDNFGQGVFGGTTIVLSDLLGNHRLALAGAINGQVSDAQLFAGYTNLARRFQYSVGLSQQPIFSLGDQQFERDPSSGATAVTEVYYRYVQREIFGVALYPLNRFTRFELGARFDNIGQSIVPFTTIYDAAGYPINQQRGDAQSLGSASFVAPYVAYVSDNTLFGYTGPIMGRRYRFQVQPTVGSWRWMEYLVDYRRYDPILFNFLTVATRASTSLTMGRDERRFPKYIGRPDFVRGYNRENYVQGCESINQSDSRCGALQLLGSRVAYANAELRFPLIRRFDLGVLPIALPPIDALVFYDAGVAWSAGQSLSATRPDGYNFTTQRYPLTSYGFGVRFNLFNFAIVRWDYAKPLDQSGRNGFGTWSFGPSF